MGNEQKGNNRLIAHSVMVTPACFEFRLPKRLMGEAYETKLVLSRSHCAAEVMLCPETI